MTKEMYEDLLERNKLQISELNTLTEEQDRHIIELEEEKCELLGIIQGKDKVIQELKKENAELDCQMNRNKYCYSCANVTDRCFRNEIGCPCEKYKPYKDENAALNKQLTKAKELLTKWVELFKPKGGNIPPTPIQVETEQFISEVKENEN